MKMNYRIMIRSLCVFFAAGMLGPLAELIQLSVDRNRLYRMLYELFYIEIDFTCCEELLGSAGSYIYLTSFFGSSIRILSNLLLYLLLGITVGMFALLTRSKRVVNGTYLFFIFFNALWLMSFQEFSVSLSMALGWTISAMTLYAPFYVVNMSISSSNST